MFQPSRRLAAALGTLLMAGSAAALATAPEAVADTVVTYPVHCVPPSIGGSPFDFSPQVDLTVSPAKATYNVGDQVTVTWTWKNAANNPSSVSVPANTVAPNGGVTVSGAQGGTVSMQGPQINAPAAGGQPLALSTMTGTLTLTNPGGIDLAPGAYTSVANYLGTWSTPCTPTATPAPSVHLTVAGAVTPPSVGISRSSVRPGSAPFAVTGAHWPAGLGTPAIALCAADGTSCNPSLITGSNLAVDTSGNLTGSASVPSTAHEGSYLVQVSAGGENAYVPLTVSNSAPAWDDPVAYGVTCDVLGGLIGAKFGWTPTVSLSLSPAKAYYSIGDQVTVTWHWNQYPRNPQAVAVLLANSVTPSGNVTLSGSQSGTVAVSGPANNPAAGGPPAVVQVADMTGTFKVTANGALSLAPADYTLKPILQTSHCAVAGGVTPGVSAVAQVGAPQTLQATATATPVSVAPGAAITVSGANWAYGWGAPAAQLCAADGSACDAAGISSNTLSIGPSGALSGTVTPAAGATAGVHVVKIVSGPASALTNQVTIVIPRGITLSPSSGAVGTFVTVTGVGFTPGTAIAVAGATGTGTATADKASATSAADGSFTVALAVTDANTAKITATEVPNASNTASAAFTVLPGGSGGGTVNPGSLSMSQATSGIALSHVTLDGKAQTMTGSLDTVTVDDYRGSTLGWSLVAKVTDFTSDTGGTIPASALSWTPKCTVSDPTSPSTPTAGPAGVLTSGATLCSAPASSSPNQATGGQFAANAALTLNVPAYQLAGQYTAVLTLSVS